MSSIEKTKGIVLRHFKYSETSVITEILTENNGKQSFIASGVRKKKSKIPYTYFQSFNQLEIVYYPSKNNLFRIKELSAIGNNQNINFDVVKSAIALFLSEIIANTTREGEKEKQLFDFLSKFIPFLDSSDTKSIVNIHLWASIRLMQFNGITPENNFSEKNIYFNPVEGQFCNKQTENKLTYDKTNSYILHQFLSTPLEQCAEIPLSGEKRKEILKKIIQYFSLHIEGFKTGKTLDVLSLIFE